MTPKEQAEAFIEHPGPGARPGAKYLKFPFIVYPYAGDCEVCGRHFEAYETKMVHAEKKTFRCADHFKGEAYLGERFQEDPEGFLTYSDF